MPVLSFAQLRQLAADTGFPDPDFAAQIAERESGGNTNATNIVTPEQAAAWNDAHPGEPQHGPERSFGLFQINTLAHPQYNESSLLDPNYNAQAAYTISRGGANWTPWSTYQGVARARRFPWGAVGVGAAILGLGGAIAYAIELESKR